MRKSRKLLVGMFVLHFAAGVFGSMVVNGTQPQSVATLIWAPLAILLFMWCKSDISERRIEAPAGATALVGLLAPVGVPYYFFRALPWRAATLSTALAAAAFIGMQLSLVCGSIVGERL